MGNSIFVSHNSYPGYLFSPEGGCLSLKGRTPRLMKQGRNRLGYRQVNLSHNRGEPRRVSIHRVVAELFCEKREGASQVNHIDSNPSNNHFSNLEWVTPRENVQHAVMNGRNVGRPGKYSEEFVQHLQTFHESSPSITATSKHFKLSHATTTYLLKGGRFL